MKISTFILVFYLLALSLVPCSDVHNECSDKRETTKLADQHNHENDSDDMCSPFCICNCCGISMLVLEVTPLFNIRNITFKISQKIPIHSFSFVSSFFGSFWQPPKINDFYS
ncbi:MAG: DUF6660 family protein [Leadbetterella sp.]